MLQYTTLISSTKSKTPNLYWMIGIFISYSTKPRALDTRKAANNFYHDSHWQITVNQISFMQDLLLWIWQSKQICESSSPQFSIYIIHWNFQTIFKSVNFYLRELILKIAKLSSRKRKLVYRIVTENISYLTRPKYQVIQKETYTQQF